MPELPPIVRDLLAIITTAQVIFSAVGMWAGLTMGRPRLVWSYAGACLLGLVGLVLQLLASSPYG